MTQAPEAAAAVPSVDASTVVVPAPGEGEGYWAGGPSAAYADDSFVLAYRLRRPVGVGRGYANVIAQSSDGVSFEPVVMLFSEAYGCDSLERPALVRRPDGGWRLYLSLATRDSLHWRVDAVDADDLAGLADGVRRPVWPGGRRTAVKDPVVAATDDGWHAWVCVHPLPDPAEADRMTTRYATSPDGLTWTDHGEALVPRPGLWDARGARLTAVVPGPNGLADLAFYDGRASAMENWYERTGLALGDGSGGFRAVGSTPYAESPFGERAFRYVSAVPLPDGTLRVYFEAAGVGGGHDLRTQVIDPDALRALALQG